MTFRAPMIAALLASLAGPVVAQVPGAPDLARVAAGSYALDPSHSQVAWSVNHFGFNAVNGLFGVGAGTLTVDPAKPTAARVTVEIPVTSLVTTVPKLTEHLQSAEFFDAAKFPTATFVSTTIAPHGQRATVSGTLTLHGISRPVVLDARFGGAGTNPMSKKATVGFEATTTIKRSDFGINAYVPAVGDTVVLHLTAAFERGAD